MSLICITLDFNLYNIRLVKPGPTQLYWLLTLLILCLLNYTVFLNGKCSNTTYISKI